MFPVLNKLFDYHLLHILNNNYQIMKRSELLEHLLEIFIDTLDNEEIKLSEETTANDIDEWDSLSHIMLIVAIEKHFKIRFTSKEIQSWKDVGEMLNCIEEK